MTSLFEATGVQKSFSGIRALEDVSLRVDAGERVGLIGPNGAGKTTLISVICGIVTPTLGTVSIDGFDIIKDYRETRSRIGLVPQELNLESNIKTSLT